MSPVKKIPSISDEYEYLNIRIKLTSNNIRIRIFAVSGIRIYSDICSEPYFNIRLSIFNEKSISRYVLWQKNIQCEILFRGNMSEPF